MASPRWGSVPRLAAVLAIAAAPMFAGARPAGAQPTREDRAAATALFDDGRKLVAAKKFAEACPKFEAAMRLDPGMGTLFNLSDCYEKIGRIASAWSGFRDVAAQAKAANLPDREQVARDRAAALEGKLAKVRITVPAELAGATMAITRDGSAVPSALVGTPIPLDPGPHTIRVAIEGRAPWETKVTLPEAGGTVDVNVPVTEVATGGAAPTASATTTAAPVSTGSGAPTATGPTSIAPTAGPVATDTPPPAGSPRPWQKPLGITATVAGVLGLGAGIALGAVAKSQADGADCTPGTGSADSCSAAGVKTRNDALALGDVGTIVGIAGSVVGAAGIALWILAPSAPAAPAAPAQGKGSVNRPRDVRQSLPRDVRVGASIQGITVRGRF